jgi:tripartite-type tricarboxylate transporter receptor subunit TctC
MSMRLMFALSLVSVVLAAPCEAAQAPSKYPSRPIRVIVPYTPGGITGACRQPDPLPEAAL